MDENTKDTKDTKDTKKELMEVAVITPFQDFVGERVDSDKRCYAGKTPDEKDEKGVVTKRGKAIPTMNKVRIRLPIPITDEQAEELYKVSLATLVAMGIRQRAYTLNKSDIYLATIGEKDIDTQGLKELVEADLPIVERARATSETKTKAAKYDALREKFGDELSDDDIAAAIVLAMKKKGKKNNK